MDSDYLKEHIGNALTLGLSEITQKKPVDPIDFLASWLRKYVENREDKIKADEKAVLLAKEKEKAEEEMRRHEAMVEEQNQIANDTLKKNENEGKPMEVPKIDIGFEDGNNAPTVNKTRLFTSNTLDKINEAATPRDQSEKQATNVTFSEHDHIENTDGLHLNENEAHTDNVENEAQLDANINKYAEIILENENGNIATGSVNNEPGSSTTLNARANNELADSLDT